MACASLGLVTGLIYFLRYRLPLGLFDSLSPSGNYGAQFANKNGNLILSQSALDRNDIPGAKRYLLEAAASPGARIIELSGLDTSVARTLLQRGERDTVLEYFNRGRNLWPQGGQLITRWETIIRAGRMPNFNNRGQGQN